MTEKCRSCGSEYAHSETCVWQAATLGSDAADDVWLNRVQAKVRGVEFYFPSDARNPAPGRYAVVGPTSEMADSGICIAHAAMLFLSLFLKDEEARRCAAITATSRRGTP